MKDRKGRDKTGKRRITLTLPSGALAYAKRIARARKVNLSAVIAEALTEGLRMRRAAKRSEALLISYRRAFEGFSDQEMLLLDGIVLGSPNADE